MSPFETPLCVIAGDGDDYVQLTGTAAGLFAEYSGTVLPATVVGGPGADEFRYDVSSANVDNVYRPHVVIKDYEAGVDTISINTIATLADPTINGGVGFFEIDDFDATTSANEYSSPTAYALVVDAADGELWLSRYNEGAQRNYLIAVIEGDSIDVDDIELLLP